MRDDDFVRPPVQAHPPMTQRRFNDLHREQHRPYEATAGILCLACSLPNIPGDHMAPVVTFWPCMFARIFEYAESEAAQARQRIEALTAALEAISHRARWTRHNGNRDLESIADIAGRALYGGPQAGEDTEEWHGRIRRLAAGSPDASATVEAPCTDQ